MVETQASDPAAGKSKHKVVKLQITYNGLERRIEVKDSDTIASVLATAISLFTVTEAHHLLGLFGEDGLELVDTQTVGEAGLKNNARLVLRQSAVRGG